MADTVLPSASAPVEDSTLVTFDLLAGYRYDDNGTDEERAAAIPTEVAGLDGQVVTVRGYMVPLTLDAKGGVQSFLLTENQLLCCYGIMPALNEWIAVDMAGGGSAPLHADRPVTVTGLLSVGEAADSGGAVSLYRMTGEQVSRVAGRNLRALGQK